MRNRWPRLVCALKGHRLTQVPSKVSDIWFVSCCTRCGERMAVPTIEGLEPEDELKATLYAEVLYRLEQQLLNDILYGTGNDGPRVE